MIQWILLSLALIVFLQDLLVLFFFQATSPGRPVENPPVISVLVAARNEEDNIADCLHALLNQDYPSSRMEILVGDDASHDQTASIVGEFAEKNPIIRAIAVPRDNLHLSGKARVIDYLARQASGEYFLITDADVIPGQEWATSLTSAMQSGDYDLVNGITGVRDSRFQDMEWIHAQGMLTALASVWKPVTAIGNNTGISRRAYWSTGGYQQIPFSLTEDLALFRAASAKGFRLKQLFETEALSMTRAEPTASAYLQQRRRWLSGVLTLPILVQLTLALQSVFLLYCLALLAVNPVAAVMCFAIRVLVRMPLWARLYRSAGREISLWHSLWFEIVSGVVNLALILYALWPGRIIWKGRKY